MQICIQVGIPVTLFQTSYCDAQFLQHSYVSSMMNRLKKRRLQGHVIIYKQLENKIWQTFKWNYLGRCYICVPYPSRKEFYLLCWKNIMARMSMTALAISTNISSAKVKKAKQNRILINMQHLNNRLYASLKEMSMKKFK